MITGSKKRLAMDAVKYYMLTTEKNHTDFIANVKEPILNTDTVDYPIWLAHKLMNVLTSDGVTIEDIVQMKDSLRTIGSNDGEIEGEFYTPEVWCVEARKSLKEILGDQWGKIYIWDASCGTGNLMRSEGYPQDKLFLSTLLEEDIPIVKEAYPDATVFQCNFLDDIDYDGGNEFFSNKLPERLREILRTNQPILFFMNPPYKQTKIKCSDVGEYMSKHDLSVSARDICFQFVYRILMIKEYYNLTNIWLALFHPCTLLQAPTTKPLMTEVLKNFEYKHGLCLSGDDFGETRFGFEWSVTYTIWKARTDTADADMQYSFLTDVKLFEDNEIKNLGKRTFRFVDEPMGEWIEDTSVEGYIALPTAKSMLNIVPDSVSKIPIDAIGILSGDVKRLGGKNLGAWVQSLPYDSESIAITKNNLWRAVPALITVTLKRGSNFAINKQIISRPNTKMKGYDEWIINCLPAFLFSYKSFFAAYRNINVNRQVYNLPNKMFPISKDIVAKVVTDKNVIADMESNKAHNEYILSQIEGVKDKFSKEAKEFYDFCMLTIMESLLGNVREQDNYMNYTVAWDASFQQIRSLKTFWTQDKEQKYRELWTKLKSSIEYGIFEYGLLSNVDTSYVDNEE